MMWDALKRGVEVHSAAAMEAIGRGLARSPQLSQGGTLALVGDLGSGKTTLVRGIAQALGIDSITSPSFNYYFLYRQGRQPLLHLDAYRLARPQDFPSLMIDELLTPQTLFVVEWPDKLGQYLPAGAHTLSLSIAAPGVHQLKYLS